MGTPIPTPFRKIFASCAALLVFPGPLLGLETARREISPLGIVGLGAGETIILRATASVNGSGCHAQLGFENGEGRLVTRSLNVNLGPGLSASTHFTAGAKLTGRLALRPVAWVEEVHSAEGDCTLAIQITGAPGNVSREYSAASNCEGASCSGIQVTALGSSTLRLHVVAARDQVCRAQMGFRLSGGRTSAIARFVTLMPGHAASLDWRPADEYFPASGSVVPVAAFHKGDSCLATAEVFAAESGPAVAVIPVHCYVSPVVGLALDPASINKTIHTLEARLRTNPEDLWAINALAQAYDRHGEHLEAIKLISSALEANPRASESWLLLARFQYGQDDFKSAVTALKKCLALDPRNDAARAAYADSLARDHRMEAAGRLFAGLLRVDRTRTPAVLTAYADFLYRQGRADEALDFIQQADTRHPNCERTLYVKSTILVSMKRLPEATQSAEQVVRLDSTYRPARLLLAKLYFQQGKTQEAADQVAWLRAHTNAER